MSITQAITIESQAVNHFTAEIIVFESADFPTEKEQAMSQTEEG